MGARAEQLASKFEQSCRDFESTVDRLDDSQWKTITPAEKWTVGVVAHHVAGAHAGISGLVEMVAKGQPLPHMTMDMIHEGNAKHAKEFASVGKAETLALLKANGAKAAAIVRGLSDAELDRTAPLLAGMPPMSAAQAIEGILINHANEHLGAIRAATGAK
jgi:Mycothiol maleylpyruvate isomerase N-terminal domain